MEVKASMEEKDQAHKADRAKMLRNLGNMKASLSAFKRQCKSMKVKNADKERVGHEDKKKEANADRRASTEDVEAMPSVSKKGKRKKTTRKTRQPLGVVPGNQAVMDICGGELSERLKLRRSRRLSGGYKNKENSARLPASAKKARKILGALSNGKNTTY